MKGIRLHPRIRRFTPLLLLLAMLAFNGTFASCSGKKIEPNPTVETYFELLDKKEWSTKDKADFIALFSIRGLNQLLQSYDAKSFGEFEKKRTREQARYGTIDVFSGQASGHRYTSGWQRKELHRKKVYLTRFDLLQGARIHDVQTKQARATYVPGAGVIIFRVVYVIGFILGIIVVITAFSEDEGCGGCVFSIVLIAIISGVGQCATGVKDPFKPPEVLLADGERFDDAMKTLKGPYAGQDTSTVHATIQQKVIEVSEALGRNRAGNNFNTTMARSFKEKGLEALLSEEVESKQKAIAHLFRSLNYQSNAETFVDLAYAYTSLGRVGENPDANFYISSAILDYVARRENFSSENPEQQVRAIAVKSINLVYSGNKRQAKALWASLTAALANQPENNGEDGLNKDERSLEARYLLEEDAHKRLALADDLIRRSANNPRYYNYKGIASYHAGDDEIAKRSFERAIAIQPGYQDAQMNLKAVQTSHKPRFGISLVSSRLKNVAPDFPYRAVYAYSDLLTPTAGIAKTLAAAAESSTPPGASANSADEPEPEQAEEGESFWKTGLVGVWHLRASNGRKTGAVLGFLFVAWIVLTFSFFFYDDLLYDDGAIIFWQIVTAGALYFVVWGFSGWGSFILMVIFIFIVIGFTSDAL
ncbi:MAG: tetratricopeptide repeat protein [bacterium]